MTLCKVGLYIPRIKTLIPIIEKNARESSKRRYQIMMTLLLCDLFWDAARKLLQIYKNSRKNLILIAYSVIKSCVLCSEIMYLTPVSNFPLRTWTKITICCSLWLRSTVTQASPSTTFDCALFLSISTRHWALWNNGRQRLNNWHLIGRYSDPLNECTWKKWLK